MDEPRSNRTQRSRSPEPEPGGPLLALAAAGLALGASAFLDFGFYDLTVWGPIALGALALVAALWFWRPVLPAGPSLVALGGLLGVALWSLLATRWAGSADFAPVAADRWFFY